MRRDLDNCEPRTDGRCLRHPRIIVGDAGVCERCRKTAGESMDMADRLTRRAADPRKKPKKPAPAPEGRQDMRGCQPCKEKMLKQMKKEEERGGK